MKLVNMSAALLCVVSLVACSSSKVEADAALKAVNDAYNKVREEGQTYVPARTSDLQEDINNARAAWGRGNYDSASRSARAVLAEIERLGAAVAAKKAELAKTWPDLSVGVPPLLAALKSRVEALSKGKGVPAGLSQGLIDSAKSGYVSAAKGWDDVMAAANTGDLGAAALKGERIKADITAIMTSLRMPLPKS
jgi:hypothetical protein